MCSAQARRHPLRPDQAKRADVRADDDTTGRGRDRVRAIPKRAGVGPRSLGARERAPALHPWRRRLPRARRRPGRTACAAHRRNISVLTVASSFMRTVGWWRILLTMATVSCRPARAVSAVGARAWRSSAAARLRGCRPGATQQRNCRRHLESTSHSFMRAASSAMMASASRAPARARAVGFTHALQVVDVVKVAALDAPDLGVEVARHSDVDQEQRWAPRRR